ncbi:MAG: ion transporter [Cyclobacteriaceae bacterium]|nr:ion transporter [Cyclobacteriaceae bacterium HetDA_MAG_MS6]
MTRLKLRNFFESDDFQHFIVSVIIINSVLIGLETSAVVMDSFGPIIDIVDLVILGIFVAEMLAKIYAYRLSFFKSSWNLFDASIIMISILPAAGSFTVFRALRIVRTLRLLKNIPKLKIIIESLLHAVPSIGWIAVLLMIVYYIFAVIGTNLFGVDYPEYFGSLGKSFYTLFQIMTLESWSSAIARPIQEGVPFAALYFVLFILIATYTTLNIFIAIVVNTMNELHHRDLQEEEEHIKEFVTKENDKLHKKLDKLSKELRTLRKEEPVKNPDPVRL